MKALHPETAQLAPARAARELYKSSVIDSTGAALSSLELEYVTGMQDVKTHVQWAKCRRPFRPVGALVFAILAACVLAIPSVSIAQATSVLRVRVQESESAQPIVGARVTLHRGSSAAMVGQAVTNTDGIARFPLLTAGRVYVSVRHLGRVPIDTAVHITGDSDIPLALELRSLSALLTAVQVTADGSRCPAGFGSLGRTAPFASLILAAVDSQLQPPNVSLQTWRVVETRRLVDASGDETEWAETEWVTDNPPALEGLTRDSLQALGYSWRTESRWHFALPHPSTFSTRDFERLHCFSVAALHAGGGREIRFVPAAQKVPNQLSGRLVFDGEPLSIARLDLYYRGDRKYFRDSAAYASITFTATENGSVRISGWNSSIPALPPRKITPRASYPGAGVDANLPVDSELVSRVESRTRILLDTNDGSQLRRGGSYRVLRRETESRCSPNWTSTDCLQFGITSLHHAKAADDPTAALVAIGYLASVCRAGPLPVRDSELHLGYARWVRQVPLALPDEDTRAQLRAFWEEGREASGQSREAIARHVQLEACGRLHLELARDEVVVAREVPRELVAEWTCANGEGANCVVQALALSRKTGNASATEASQDAVISRYLERGCFLRASDACRLLAYRDSVFDLGSYRVSRLRADGSTEPASNIVHSRAVRYVSSKSAVDERVREQLASDVRSVFMENWPQDIQISEYSGGIVMTFAVSDPDRVTSNPLRPATEAMVEALGALLRRRTDVRAAVVIHSDSAWLPSGSLTRQVRNRQIRAADERRVEAWTAKLVAAGAERRRLRVHTAWDGEPLYSNLTRIGQQLNRRVEIALYLQ